MKKYKFGDVILIEFPFTDGKNTKKRPALVLYHDIKDQEFMLARITSKIYQGKFDVVINNWQDCGLLLKSCIRLGKIATLHNSLLYKKLGEISIDEYQNIISKLCAIFQPEN